MDDQGARREQQATARRASGGEQIYSFSGGIVKGPGGGGASTDLATFRRRGLFISEQPTLDDHSVITGWLPDGVASVDVSYPSQVVRDPRRPATVYGEEIHLTIPAQDNLVSYEVDRPAEDALPPETVWRAADGSVVRVVRGE